MIDCHVHVGGYEIRSPRIYGWLSINGSYLKKYMETDKLDKVWLLSHPLTVPNYELNNDLDTLEMAQHDKRIIPFCSPSRASVISSLVEKGCKGIGEIKTVKPINHKKLMEIYQMAGEYGLPVVIHTNNKYCYGDSLKLHFILSKYRKTNFVLHGWGIWNLFKTGVKVLLDAWPNLFLDLSANSGYLTLKKDLGYTEEFLTKYPDRVLFGTDFPMLTTFDGTQFGVNGQLYSLIKDLHLSGKDEQKIFSGNAEKLIK